ncbi:LlaJI family restriction endonuclease [Candidatus Enterovibrio altilux]|uniref:LlaJI family restriction endonuclease n=1 Tax=Candidatus Enterovibrio altilux TaxID=1927128 RepID=UPI001237B6EF|nr:LlaJI family restriction endonuclease [Candidatus Enterovibrio luxaltus]
MCNTIINGDESLKGLFPQPRYRYKEGISRQKPKIFMEQIPDTLVRKEDTLIVIDVKYYNIKIKSTPGWSDLVKQFYYGWSATLKTELKLRNILAFPGEEYSHIGEVYMENKTREYTELGVVECLEVPIVDFMKAYLRNDSSTYLDNILQETSIQKLIHDFIY